MGKMGGAYRNRVMKTPGEEVFSGAEIWEEIVGAKMGCGSREGKRERER